MRDHFYMGSIIKPSPKFELNIFTPQWLVKRKGLAYRKKWGKIIIYIIIDNKQRRYAYWKLVHSSVPHYSDVIMSAMALRLKSPASRLFSQTFVQKQIKENIKAPRHWPLLWEGNPPGRLPSKRASSAENISIWRHHEKSQIIWFIVTVPAYV